MSERKIDSKNRKIGSKKRKIEEENRMFHIDWESLYFFVQIKNNAVYLIFRHSISTFKLYN